MKPVPGLRCAALGALYLFLTLLSPTVHASGFVVVRLPDAPDVHRPPLTPIELRQHQTETAIKDQVAVTTIEQVFHNPTSHRLEGTYCFPLPIGAQIDRFSLFIDGKETEAELLPSDKARGVYEDIVRRMRDPALLEFMGHGLFKVRIFPFEPQSDRRIRLQYTEILPRDSGLVQFTLPMHRLATIGSHTITSSVRVTIESKQPLGTIYSPTHDVEIKRDGTSRAVVGFERTIARSGDPHEITTGPGAFQLFYSRETSGHDVGVNLMTYRAPESDEDGYFLMLLTPGAQLSSELGDDRVVGKDIVFALDTSGSMSGGKLDQAKRALRFCLDNLNKGDRFEIVRFSTEAEPLFGALAPADEDHRAKAATFLEDLRPIGGTAIDAALQEAVTKHHGEDRPADRPYFVIFLTDGRPTVGTKQPEEILANLEESMNDRHARVFAFGIGHDVNAHLLDQVATQTRGISQYVLPEEDIEIKVSNFYAKISDPILAGVELAFGEGIRTSKMYPQALPDLFRGDQLVVLGRYRGDGDAAITLTGSVNGAPHALTYESAFAAEATEHEFIPRLWATRRIGFLLDQLRLHGESDELRDEIARLARTYGIVTPYTSYLILEDEAHRDVPIVRRTLQSLEAPPGAAPSPEREAIADQFGRMRSEASGELAVNTARSNQTMRDATNAGEMLMIIDHARRGARQAIPQQLAQMVRGRAFFQNGEMWIDSNVQSAPEDVKLVRIAFDSEAYYKLLREHPEAAPWLSVGRNVQVLLGETIYEIHEPAEAG